MAITTYIPPNFQPFQPSFIASTIIVFLVIIAFIGGYYAVFGVDKREVPEEFKK